MTKLLTVPIDVIDANPYRDLGLYPFMETKITALKRSIKTVGLWEGVIVRKVGKRYQTAFGHHRMEAARRAGLTDATIILRDLDDKQMLQFMGRENMEDYNADFLTMLQTWDAAVAFWPSKDGQAYQPIDIANLLGWTQDRTKRDSVQMNRTAEACNATHKLLQDGFLKREAFIGATVSQAREVCTRAQANVDRIVRIAKKTKRPAVEVKEAKKQIAKAVVKTIKEAVRNEVPQKDLRGQVDINTYRFAKQSKKKSPLFAQFGQQLKNNIAKVLNSDSLSGKLEEVKKALGQITLEVDLATVRAVKFELDELSERATKWGKAMNPKKVVNLKEVSND